MRTTALLPLLFLFACGPDADGDGFGRRDCDDERPLANPRAEERCNGLDDDCDGFVDEGVSIVAYWDRDGDGFGDDDFASRVCELPADGSLVAGDCNDLDDRIHPEAEEICNEADDDCDRSVDEEVLSDFFPDADGDGDGTSGETTAACSPPDGFAWTDTDCDDSDATRFTGADEICDAIDNDCNGLIDDEVVPSLQYVDADGDGYGDPAEPTTECGAGFVDNDLDCNDADAAHNPDTVEIAGNGADEDCDGWIDEIAVPDHYSTLADAIDASSAGDVVQLGGGTFFETADLTGHDITLAGRGCGQTLLYGDGNGSVVQTDGASLRDLGIGGGSALTGGGVLVSGDVEASGVCVESNFASEDGGGIAVVAGSLVLEDSLVARNQSTDDGGGIWLAPETHLTAKRVRFVANNGSIGGALAAERATADIRACVFADNRGRAAGGAVASRNPRYDDEASDDQGVPAVVTLTNISFIANRSGNNGQATYNYRSELYGTNLLAAWHDRDRTLFYAISEGAQQIDYVASWRNAGTELVGAYDPHAFRGDPLVVAFDAADAPETWDAHLAPGSPLIDAGDPSITDLDGTQSDIGAYGGPDAGSDFGWGYQADSDADGLFDGWEVRNGTLRYAADATADPDVDGLDNTAEAAAGSMPRVADTDADGVEDGAEVDAGDNPIDARDHAPLASAGVTRWVRVGASVQLDGTGSYEPDGDPLTYRWSMTPASGGSSGVLTDITTATPTLTPDATGLWLAKLTVDDGFSTSTAEVEVVVVDGHVVPDDKATIQEAVDTTPAGGAVLIQPGVYYENIDFAGRDVDLVGLGEPHEVVIDGGGQDSVLKLVDGEASQIARLTIRGGSARDGGGILAGTGTVLSLEQVIVENNWAQDRGGGVFANTADLSVRDSTFRANSTSGYGGAMRVQGAPLLAERVLFDGNEAAEYGGALYTTSGVNFEHTVRNSLFHGNAAPAGAAVHHFGSATSLRLDNSVVVANAGDSVLSLNSGTLTYNNTVLAYNDAPVLVRRGDNNCTLVPLFTLYHGNSGDLYSHAIDELGFEPGSVHASPSVVSWSDDGIANDLWAPLSGSPMLDAGHPEQLDRDGSRSDIGIFGGVGAPFGAEAWVRDSDGDGLSDGWENLFGLDPTTDDTGFDADGDGITNGDEFVLGTDPTKADSDGDGYSDAEEVAAGTNPTDASDNRPTADAGADLRAQADTLVQLDSSGSFDPNGDPITRVWTFASVPAGSSITDASLSDASGVAPSFTPDVRGDYILVLTVSDARSTSNPDSITVGVFGELHVPAAYATLELALAEVAPGDIVVLAAGEYPATVHALGAQFTIRGAGIGQTVLVGEGGHPVTRVEAGGHLTLEDLTVTGGTGNAGGGAECDESTLVMRRVHLTGNAGYAGGAVGIQDCMATFDDVAMTANASAFNGGALYSKDSTLDWLGGELTGNAAGASGGAIYADDTVGSIANLVIADNETPSTGGAVYLIRGELFADHLTVVRNVGNFGAYYLGGSAGGHLRHSIFASNGGYGVYRISPVVDIEANGYFDNDSGPSNPSAIGENADNVLADPRFVGLTDFRLRHDSPMRDAGLSGCTDPDDTACDLGAWGGPTAAAGFDAWYADADADGLPDGWQAEYGVTGAGADPDADGLSNAEELALGSDPTNPDSDGDGIPDGTDPDPVAPAAHTPVADAGDDVIVDPAVPAMLDGSASSDPNGDPLTYAWQLIDLPARSTLDQADVGAADTATPTFTPDVPGRYVFELVVSDGTTSSAASQAAIYARGSLAVPEDYPSVATAIDALVSGETVQIAEGTWPMRVDLDGKSVTLEGAGRALTVLDAEGLGRHLLAASGETVTLTDLTLTGGVASIGGAVLAEGGALTLTGVAIHRNDAVQGGGISLDEVDLTVTDCRFTENFATRYGGAIYAFKSTVDVVGALFAANSAIDLNGGALHSQSSQVDVRNAVFHDNFASYGAAAMVASISSDPQRAVFSHVTATYNEAEHGGGFLRLSLHDADVLDSIVAFTRGGDAFYRATSGSGTFVQQNTLVFDNAPMHYHNIDDLIGTEGNVEADPRLWDVTDDGDWTNDDWHLKPSSPGIDAASDLDADGSDGNLGAFGGPSGSWEP